MRLHNMARCTPTANEVKRAIGRGLALAATGAGFVVWVTHFLALLERVQGGQYRPIDLQRSTGGHRRPCFRICSHCSVPDSGFLGQPLPPLVTCPGASVDPTGGGVGSKGAFNAG